MNAQLTANAVAVVLAGGMGAGLKGLTARRAKAALSFGGTYRLIDVPLSSCINSGIRRIAVIAQHHAHSVRDHLRQGWPVHPGPGGGHVEMLSPRPGDRGGRYEGTADAVYKNLDTIRHCDPRYVLILSGDQVYRMDYGELIAAHAESGADLTVACIPVPLEEARAFGVMALDETRRCVDFTERPKCPDPMPDRPDEALASMGIYVFTFDFLQDRLAPDAGCRTSRHDFGLDIIPGAVRDANVFGFPHVNAGTGDPKYWRHVATLDAYWGAQMDLLSGQTGLDLHDVDWPIHTRRREPLPPATLTTDSDGLQGHAAGSLVSDGCRICGATVQGSVLSTRARVRSNASVVDSVVLPGADLRRNARIRRTIVDEGVTVPEGMEIGYDPERDREQFEVTPGGIVLVTSDRLGQPA